jgi:16S rRNA (cytosine1402-N4)-methyltransferase
MSQAQTIKEKMHESVMVGEVLEAFGLNSDAHLNDQGSSVIPEPISAKQGWFIDATLGNGGHTLELIKKGGQVLGIEWDKNMLDLAENRLIKAYSEQGRKACPPPDQNSVWGSYTLVHGNFKDIAKITKKANFLNVDGILFDLGVSNIHLTSETRGFSFLNPDAPLDMRINPDIGPTAADLLNVLRQDQLESLFLKVLKTNEVKKLVNKIIVFRKIRNFKNIGDFLRVCEGVIDIKGKIHPSTRAFLALRMAVNSELENLQEALPSAFSILKTEGKLVVISFHSAEDLIVKDFFKLKERSKTGFLINKKPIVPKVSEIQNNPKARSAKMRILEKIK